jgi:hypothetical protein
VVAFIIPGSSFREAWLACQALHCTFESQLALCRCAVDHGVVASPQIKPTLYQQPVPLWKVIVGHSRADILSRARKGPASSLFAAQIFAIKNFSWCDQEFRSLHKRVARALGRIFCGEPLHTSPENALRPQPLVLQSLVEIGDELAVAVE